MMKIKKLTGYFEADFGAPEPIVVSNANKLMISFNVMDDKWSKTGINANESTIDIRFNRYIHYSFGMPGNETLHEHPYANLGLESSSFYELENSDLIGRLRAIEKGHPYYDSESWTLYKHYIITFHDNMFECIAHGFDIISERNDNMFANIKKVINIM